MTRMIRAFMAHLACLAFLSSPGEAANASAKSSAAEIQNRKEELFKKYSSNSTILSSDSSTTVDGDGWVSEAEAVDDSLRVTFRLDPKRYAGVTPSAIQAFLVPKEKDKPRPRTVILRRVSATNRKPVTFSAKPDGGYETWISLPEDQLNSHVLWVAADIEPGWAAESQIRLAPSGAPENLTGVFYFKEKVDERPAPVHQSKPEVTDDTKSAAGYVVVWFIVEKDGTVAQSKAVAGVDLRGAPTTTLLDLAEKCVKQWQYKPALRNGKPVRCKLEVAVKFGTDSDKGQGAPKRK